MARARRSDLLLGAGAALGAAAIAIGVHGVLSRSPAPAALAPARVPASARAWSDLPPDVRPFPIGRGRRYRLPTPPVRASQRLPCIPGSLLDGQAMHLELFAHRQVVLIPRAVGVRNPGGGQRVRRASCHQPVWTLDATGVVRFVALQPAVTIGDLFDAWQQPLSATKLAAFTAMHPHGAVTAFVNGEPWKADPRSIPLRRHDEVVLEIDGKVPPHASFPFAPGS